MTLKPVKYLQPSHKSAQRYKFVKKEIVKIQPRFLEIEQERISRIVDLEST